MTVSRLSLLVLLFGSLMFLVVAGSPISWIFGERDPAKRLEFITARLDTWRFAQMIFGAGALVAAIGVLLLAIDVRKTDAGPQWMIAGLLMVGGAMSWIWHSYLRGMDPAGWVAHAHPIWLFPLFSLMNQAALVFLGLALFKFGAPRWVGWTSIVSGISFAVLMAIFRDMPPFVYYLVLGIIGVVLW
jgi:hypothetical protein